MCGIVDGADQSSWAAELAAVLHTVVASRIAHGKSRHNIFRLHLAIDCLSVATTLIKIVEALLSCVFVKLPIFGNSMWRDIEDALRLQPLHNLFVTWMPSHGKQANWCPPCSLFGNASVWRKANDRADVAAKEGPARQEQRYALRQREAAHVRAHNKTMKWLRKLFHASHDYFTSVSAVARHCQKWILNAEQLGASVQQ